MHVSVKRLLSVLKDNIKLKNKNKTDITSRRCNGVSFCSSSAR